MAWIRNRPVGLVYRDASLSEDGYTLFCSVRGHHATLLDPEARMVARWHHPEGIQHAQLLESGNLLIHTLPPEDAGGAEQIGGSAGALLELDWNGKVVWEYRNPYMHHAYVRLPNGHHLLLAWRKLPDGVQEQIRGGHSHPDDPERMWGDIVLEIDPAGRTVREWLSWEHLSFEEDEICPLESYKEWTHANSLALTAEGDWLISFRLTSTVAIIDGQTGDLKWRWGPGFLSHQHAATPLDTGNILIFDNGCHRKRLPSFSQIVEIDPATKEVAWTYRAPVILAFFSFMVSGAERLPGGNTLITEGATGRIFEVTPEGEIVWEYVSPFTLIDPRFGPTPAVFRAHRYPQGDARFAGKLLDPARYADLMERIERTGLEPGDE